jgi:hypothetical protein
MPLSETTSISYLTDCCIIEIDFDSIEESIANTEESTQKIVLLYEKIVGELTRKAILFNTDRLSIDVQYRQSFTAERKSFWIKPTATEALIKDNQRSAPYRTPIELEYIKGY